MKKFLKFVGPIVFLLALVAFILMMATPAIMYKGEDVVAKGIVAIFGEKKTVDAYIVTITGETKLAWSALLAWIFILITLLITCLEVVLPLLKVKAMEKYVGALNLIVGVLLLVAGVFMFITCPVFFTANGAKEVPNNCALGAGWIIGGILAVLGGLCAACSALLGKKK